jgi:hypothetical protein
VAGSTLRSVSIKESLSCREGWRLRMSLTIVIRGGYVVVPALRVLHVGEA